jgi:Zn-dependent peptidase ImmA (M78 family)
MSMVRRKHIRTLVERLLASHQVRQQPVPVESIANGLGVQIQKESAEDKLSGFLFRDRTKDQAIIGVNADHPPKRQRFTTAHELGHFLLHDFGDVHVDRQFKVWLRNGPSSDGVSTEEKEANLFAAELLMPAKFLQKDFRKIDAMDMQDEKQLADLAEQYDVSTQAMTIRLAYLGYIEQ